MTTNAVQIRMPSVLLKNIEDLVKQGFYKNKSEAIIDAVRHFVGFGQAKSDIAIFIREEMHGRKIKRGYSKKEFDTIWEKVRLGQDWKERFGTDADSVMKELRRRR
jgi:Arc/MetJ-type ribon-helix-helix transcriptional regulator